MSFCSRLAGQQPPQSRLDLAAPQIARDPYPTYAALRQRGPVHYLAHHDFWLVLSYAEVKEAFERSDVFSNSPYAPIDEVLLAADGARHASVRRIVGRQFSGPVLARLETLAFEGARGALGGTIDAVADFGVAISRGVTASLLGFHEGAVAEIVRADAASRTAPHAVAAFIQELDRIAPAATLFKAFSDGGNGGLDEAARRSLVRLLWLAGTITTERVITRSILRLLEEPWLRAPLIADADLVGPFIEEIMRLHPPELAIPRRTVRPVTLGGIPIPEGKEVRLCIAAANRDRSFVPEPDALRLDGRASLHFTFGGGVHRCLGAQLARRTAAASLRALLHHDPEFAAAEPLDQLSWSATPTALSPLRLLVATR